MNYNYIIVGQGIAGTLLAHLLIKAGKKVIVIDDGHKTSSTKIAAGLFNPITGRRYVKSWKYQELYDFALATYQEFDELLDMTCFEPRNIVRVLFNNKEENDYYARSGEPSYQKYMLEEPNIGAYKAILNPVYSIGEVTVSGRVNVGELIAKFRNYLIEHQAILSETFEYKHLEITESKVNYKTISADKIIFCEGIKGTENPYFKYLPFNGAKGEILIIKIQNFKPEKIFKHRVFLVPIGKDLFWVGATSDNDYENDLPTEYGKKYLLDKLNKILNIPFEVITHQAAIRPNVKDRRPFIGQHPNIEKLFIFNGLGGKGASLAPYFAAQFADYLLNNQALNNQALNKEVDINRFNK